MTVCDSVGVWRDDQKSSWWRRGPQTGGPADRCVNLPGGGHGRPQLLALPVVVWRHGGVGWAGERERGLGCQSKQGGLLALPSSKHRQLRVG